MSETSQGAGNFWIKVGEIVGVVIVLALVGLILFRMLFVDFIDNYQLGYKFDARTGMITLFKEPGYVVTPPFLVKVHTVDLRPMQVCINANQRVLNCKLVQFDLKGVELFLSWHGRNDYEGPGGGQQSSGATAFSEILKSYAYEGSNKNYPFLIILRELKPEEAATGAAAR